MKIWNVLVLLVIAAIVSAATLRLAGQPAGEGEQAKTALLEHLKPGQSIAVKAEAERYELTVWPDTIRPLSHKVVAVGPDYVRVRDMAQVSDTLIPVYSIGAIRVMRIGSR
jgi:hypothetical protein